MSSSVRTEGGLLPADLLGKIAAADGTVPGLTAADLGLEAGERLREAITRSWNRLVGAWAALEAVRSAADASDPLVGPTRERFLLPLFEELGFARLPVARAVELDGVAFPISHAWSNDAGTVRVPIHLVGLGVSLDSRSRGVRGAAGAAPHALVQDYLNRADDSLWGLVTNGRILRLLRDSTSLTRQAFIEFDLQSMFEGALYADFALLWTVCHRTRFEAERPADCLLERWTKKAADDGTRALDKLRGGVESAIETLGAGFLAHPANAALRDALRDGTLDRQDYYRELLRLVYRLIFLFTAEDRHDEETGRELLLDPTASDEAVSRYRESYSTARLRDLAIRRRGTRHGDLWVVLRRVVAALGGDGAPTIALPALGSFLFGPDACPHLDTSELRNEDLLAAVRGLTTIEEDRRLRAVDYLNLGAEELGSVYEGLLELHPRVELNANPPRFTLGSVAGNERKATGSYYTPTSLISCLLDSALDPVVDAAIAGKGPDEAEATLLGLAVVDPAAGSGHFLVAAAHRLAKRLAAIRTGEGEPPPRAVRHALRDVIARCIHAVDINPMAVELCKVSLWLEALEPGKPLTFLDAHIKCGNSLLGTRVDLVTAGIPDTAYEALTGDEKAVAKAWRSRNKQERDGQQTLFGGSDQLPIRALAASAKAIDELVDDSPVGIAEKVARHRTAQVSDDYLRARSAMDAWCAAFVTTKAYGQPEITTTTIRALARGAAGVAPAVAKVVSKVAAEYAFFQWPVEFPAVFERGGFDVVLGNPPWDKVEFHEQEFFAERAPHISDAKSGARRKALIAGLERSDPTLWGEYQAALRRADGDRHFVSNAGVLPLTARGRINLYALFAELMRSLVGPAGRVGVIVPTGVVTDDSTKAFFGDLVTRQSLVSVYDFENRDGLFPAVDSRMKFSLLTVTGGAGRVDAADLVFFARSIVDLDEEDRHFSLSPADFALINPNTRTCPTFRSARDAELAKAIYRRVPVLLVEEAGPQGNPWSLAFMQGLFNMTSDSGSFRDAPARGLVPLYEAKMLHQFTHRWATYDGDDVRDTTPREVADPNFTVRPRWWVDQSEVDQKLRGRTQRDWLLGWRDICRSTDERTVIAAAIPKVGAGNKVPLVLTADPWLPFLLSNLNSLVLDWSARQKVGGTSLNFYLLNQFPVLPPSVYGESCPWDGALTTAEWLRPRLVELVYSAHDIAPFARELGWTGPPFRWDEERRARIRAEVDAAYFHLYGIRREDVVHMIDSFPILRRRDEERYGAYRTRDLVLEAYDAMVIASSGEGFASPLDPAAGDPRAAHPSNRADAGGGWLPWAEALRARPQTSQGGAGPTGVQRSATRSPAKHPFESRSQASSAPTDPEQQSFGALFESGVPASWKAESALDPSEIVEGMRVRHRNHGVGVVLAVKAGARPVEVQIRFDSGSEKRLILGAGNLEFDTQGRR